MGYSAFMQRVDAIVMGRVSFETVMGFGIPWPYTVPVFVLSSSLTSVPPTLDGKVFLLTGAYSEIISSIHKQGLYRLYIDGGSTIQGFLNEDLIDEMIITTIPVLLGGGVPLFSELNSPLQFKGVGTQRFLNSVVQSHFVRTKT